MPDDPKITEMDPILKLWMYYNWIEDIKEKVEITKNHAYLLGSFYNPEAVRKIMDDNDSIEISEEEFEESSRLVMDESIKFNISKENASLVYNNPKTSLKKRKRKILKE